MERSFGPYLGELQAAGVLSLSSGSLIGGARGCCGGRTAEGTPVVTSWTNPGSDAGGGHRFIYKPRKNHGGLRDLWDIGAIHPGARVRLIELRSRRVDTDEIASARLMSGYWRVVTPPHVPPGETHIVSTIEPEGENGQQAEFKADEACAGDVGLRPIQGWVPDTSAMGFAEKMRRECLEIAAAEDTPEGRENVAFWDDITADAWDGLPP
jgi:hypothetical protein